MKWEKGTLKTPSAACYKENSTQGEEFILSDLIYVIHHDLTSAVVTTLHVNIAHTVARTKRHDPMLAAHKLHHFTICYGADRSIKIMVIWVNNLFNSPSRTHQPSLDSIVDHQMYCSRKKDKVWDWLINQLNGKVPAHVMLVFRDIWNSTHLWEANPGMLTTMWAHNSLLHQQLQFCGGYNVKTECDTFMCSFLTILTVV